MIDTDKPKPCSVFGLKILRKTFGVSRCIACLLCCTVGQIAEASETMGVQYEYRQFGEARPNSYYGLDDIGFIMEGQSYEVGVYSKTDFTPDGGTVDHTKLLDNIQKRVRTEIEVKDLRGVLFSKKYTILATKSHLHFFDRNLQPVKTVSYPKSAYAPSGEEVMALSKSGNHFFFSEGWIWDDLAEAWRFDGSNRFSFPVPLIRVSDRFVVQTGFADLSCVFVRSLDAAPHENVREFEPLEVCPNHGAFGLWSDAVRGLRFVDDTNLLIVYGEGYKSCLFDLETLQKGECWGESFINLDGDINRGVFYSDSGEWSVYQLMPKKLIGTGTLMDAHAFEDHPGRSMIASDFRRTGWLMGPAPGLIEPDQRLVSFFDSHSGALSIIDLKNGRLAGRQVFNVKNKEGPEPYTGGVYFWGTSMTSFEGDGKQVTDYELVQIRIIPSKCCP